MDGSLTVNMRRNEPPFFFGGGILGDRREGGLGPLELQTSGGSLADVGEEQEMECLGEEVVVDALRANISVRPEVSEACVLVVSDDVVRYDNLGM